MCGLVDVTPSNVIAVTQVKPPQRCVTQKTIFWAFVYKEDVSCERSSEMEELKVSMALQELFVER